MKTQKILLLIMFITGLLSACYEDESSLNYKLVNPIVIDLGDAEWNASQYTVFAYDTLEIKVIAYKIGVNDADLSFRWTVSGNLIVPTLLDTTMTLKKEITLQPQSNAYNLLFEVIDNTTGITQEQTFTLKVQSPFGNGLLVSDTKDGITSDVSLIMARNFNYAVQKGKDTVMHDLFSMVNKRKINGVGTALLSNAYSTKRFLTIGTANSVDRVDPFDYTYIDGNEEMFVIPPKNFNIASLAYDENSGIELISIGGKFYTHNFQGSTKKYGYYVLTSNTSDYELGKFCRPSWEYGLGFDELNGRILQYNGSKLTIYPKDQFPDAAFDLNKLQNFTCLEIFTGLNNFVFILKEKDPETGKAKAGGKIYAYFTQREAWYAPTKANNGKPIKIIDLSDCENIQNAIQFAAPDNKNVIYYATPNKVYVINLNKNPIEVTPQYNANLDMLADNEIITTMSVWKHYAAAGYIEYIDPVTGQAKQMAAANGMVIICTYNPATREGFVRTVAIKISGTGALEQDTKVHGKFKGFGKITAMTPQKSL